MVGRASKLAEPACRRKRPVRSSHRPFESLPRAHNERVDIEATEAYVCILAEKGALGNPFSYSPQEIPKCRNGAFNRQILVLPQGRRSRSSTCA